MQQSVEYPRLLYCQFLVGNLGDGRIQTIEPRSMDQPFGPLLWIASCPRAMDITPVDLSSFHQRSKQILGTLNTPVVQYLT